MADDLEGHDELVSRVDDLAAIWDESSRHRLSGQAAFVVLDNCEHVLERDPLPANERVREAVEIAERLGALDPLTGRRQ